MKKYSKLLAIILVVCMLLPGIAQAAPQNRLKEDKAIEKNKSQEEIEDEREELEDRLEQEREELEDKIEEAVEKAEEAIEDLEDIKVSASNKDKVAVMLAKAKQLVAAAKKLDKNSEFDLYIIDRIEKAIAKLEKPENPNDKKLEEAIASAENAIAALKKIKNIKLSDKKAIEDARELVNIVKQMNPKAIVKGEKDLAKFEDKIKKLEKEEEKDEAKKLEKAIKAARKDLEKFESRLNNKNKVSKLVQDDKAREKLSKSHTDVFNKIQQISDKKIKDEFLARLDKAHDKLIAATSVKSLQNAVKSLNAENLAQAKLKLSNAKTTVRFLENGDIKDALNVLVKLEEDKIKAFEAMEQEKKDKEAAANFDKLMTKFKENGEITPEYIENVRQARKAYDALSERAKGFAHPSNIGKLKRVEARIAEYEEAVKKDKEAAARVDSLIGQFPEKGEINEEYIAKVKMARKAYDALSERAKSFMIPSNIAKLARVEARIAIYEEEVKKDKEAAARVDSLIGQFPEKGEINQEYITKVMAARAAYNALNERAKGFVSPGNIAKLARVEARIAEYEENMKNAKVTLDLNGGTVKDGAVTEFVVKKGEKLKLPARIILGLEKEGYTFTGWLNTKTGEFIKQFGPEVTVTEDVTYKAVWEASKGTVLLDVYSRNPAVQIPSAIALIDKDGKRYEFKFKSYGAKTRSWETIEKLPNGEYTLEFKGLKDNTSINLEGYPLNPVINRGDAKVTPNTGNEKDQYKVVVKFLDNSPVVSSKIDMTIVESEQDILIAEAQEAVDAVERKLIRAKTLEEADAVINDAYAKVKKLPYGSPIRTELNNRLVALSQNNVVIRLLEGTDYVELLAQNRSASQAQTTLNNLQKEVDKIITTVFKTKYQNFINEQQKNVDAMVIATAATEKARKSQSMEDVNSAKELINGLIQGNVKFILGASNAVTLAEISKLKEDVDAARALVAALVYKNDRTPLEKRLDAIVIVESEAVKLQAATEAVEAAEAAKTNETRTAAQKLVTALKDGKDKDALQVRLDAIVTTEDTADAQAAAAVDALIEALPELSDVNLSDASNVIYVKEKFDALTEAQKARVKTGNKEKLAAILKVLEEEENQEIILIIEEQVSYAEETRLQEDIDEARALVEDFLQDGPIKTAFINRLDAIVPIG